MTTGRDQSDFFKSKNEERELQSPTLLLHLTQQDVSPSPISTHLPFSSLIVPSHPFPLLFTKMVPVLLHVLDLQLVAALGEDGFRVLLKTP